MNFFVSNGARLAYRSDGPEDAPALVLANSLGTDLHMWDAQIPRLSQNLRVIRYDTRGHGASDSPPGPYTLEQLGLDLLNLLDTLQIEQAHICGLSLGGITTLWLATHHPERISRAIFANTGARIGTVESWAARIETINAGGMGPIRDAILARFLSQAFRQTHPETARQIAEMIEATNPIGYMGACAALRDADLRPLLATIHIPSLILAGELDEATPPALARDLHAAIAGSEIVVFPRVAHLSNIEAPADFSACVLTFLARSSSV